MNACWVECFCSSRVYRLNYEARTVSIHVEQAYTLLCDFQWCGRWRDAACIRQEKLESVDKTVKELKNVVVEKFDKLFD